ncbi:MAG: MoxR family ATPase [Anaerolineae bacterium]|jgi:MoxR-like ATPase|nr:MoxR family ATPase [Anaerolineae bacterium]MBT7075154.1 MoxR family ATPase [Anaerolineae bacterium]MBT7782265.1 MoxR family ATPase [Anaerolineae bacterium]
MKWRVNLVNDFKELEKTSQNAIDEVRRAIVGKAELLEMIMAAILAGGHVLLEDFPGLGKTMIARSFATALGLDFKRIQFTPDLLPGDITGGYIFNRGESRFDLRQGPVFSNIVLADEINRASPKTQSALLEAMSEGQVTLEGDTMTLPNPFLVLATQNPIEYEGTFPLPEAQLDRFMLKLSVGYPTIEDEREILHRRGNRVDDELTLDPVTSAEEICRMRAIIETVHVDEDLEEYIAKIIHETRKDRRVAVGASPRGSLAFLKISRAHAALQGRDYIIPDDIKRFGTAILSHRIILQPEYWMASKVTDDVIRDAFAKVSVPVVKG